jgi:hypothetical protein
MSSLARIDPTRARFRLVASPAVRPALPLRVAADLKEKRARRPDKPSRRPSFRGSGSLGRGCCSAAAKHRVTAQVRLVAEALPARAAVKAITGC